MERLSDEKKAAFSFRSIRDQRATIVKPQLEMIVDPEESIDDPPLPSQAEDEPHVEEDEETKKRK